MLSGRVVRSLGSVRQFSSSAIESHEVNSVGTVTRYCSSKSCPHRGYAQSDALILLASPASRSKSLGFTVQASLKIGITLFGPDCLPASHSGSSVGSRELCLFLIPDQSLNQHRCMDCT
jgi:hypothetical protein